MQHSMDHKTLSIILPTYNESDNIVQMYQALKNVIDKMELNYEIIFVDDDSEDETIHLVRRLHLEDNNVKYLLMTRRYGDQKSLMAGLDYAKGDMVVVMDSDLQHPPSYIPSMVEEWEKGFDIVIMKREEAGHKNVLKKWCEMAFYKILAKISDTPIYYRFSGFALLDKKVVAALRRFRERDPFVRGLIALVGFKHTELTYKENERIAGESKYGVFDMIRLAISGITSYSAMPLYASAYLGLVAIVFCLLYIGNAFYYYLTSDYVMPGWASTIVLVSFLGGVQLVSIGVLGIYLSKIFVESKQRPNYLCYEAVGFDDAGQ